MPSARVYLTQNRDFRIYREKTVPDILTQALAIFYKGTPMSKAKNIFTVIGLILLAPILSLVGFFKFITVDLWSYFKHIGSSLSMMENGVSASGQIVSIRQTNLWDGNRPVCEVEVKYIDQDGKNHTAVAKGPISVVELPRYQPGHFTAIKYDPKNPKKAVFEELSRL